MSTRQSGKPRIAIVGAGNLASALALSLRAADYVIDQIVSRGRGGSLQRARALAAEVGASAVAADGARIRAEIVWFCVPDGEIANAAKSLARAAGWKGKVALHSSGALASDELDSLRRRGAAVASVHPLMTFVRGSRPLLAGVPFALEGSQKAVKAARGVVSDLRGLGFTVRKRQKEAYHAWGMFVSPLLTALLAASERVAVVAGVSRKAARARTLPILQQTLANYACLGAPGSFSGPIARGDIETVKKHLRVLGGISGAREVYVALAYAALRDLPAKNRASLQEILTQAVNDNSSGQAKS
ncbi:MAG: DUF2520 domain-containing protein [Candidatus Sulfotelmatobacter sp.]